MARIRTIKPEFFTSEDIVSLSPLARLLYQATWCEADKEGRLAWKPRTFKLRYLPADDCDIFALCQELVDAGLVVLYGDGLAYIPTFTRHQHINPRESVSVLPEPQGATNDGPRKVTTDVREEVMARDGRKCVRCGATEDLTLDHILPQSMNGPHIAANLRCMCRSCNSARPVSGQGLIDDLASDGLSVESLRVQFGIDASRRVSTRANQKLHAQGGREGKGKEGNTPLPPKGGGVSSPTFEDFWAEWPKSPRKAGEEQCRDKWRTRECDAVADRVMAGLRAAKASDEWTKDDGQFIPAPLVWLNQRRWEAFTEVQARAKPGTPEYFAQHRNADWWRDAGFDSVEHAHNNRCWHGNASEFSNGTRGDE